MAKFYTSTTANTSETDSITIAVSKNDYGSGEVRIDIITNDVSDLTGTPDSYEFSDITLTDGEILNNDIRVRKKLLMGGGTVRDENYGTLKIVGVANSSTLTVSLSDDDIEVNERYDVFTHPSALPISKRSYFENVLNTDVKNVTIYGEEGDLRIKVSNIANGSNIYELFEYADGELTIPAGEDRPNTPISIHNNDGHIIGIELNGLVSTSYAFKNNPYRQAVDIIYSFNAEVVRDETNLVDLTSLSVDTVAELFIIHDFNLFSTVKNYIVYTVPIDLSLGNTDDTVGTRYFEKVNNTTAGTIAITIYEKTGLNTVDAKFKYEYNTGVHVLSPFGFAMYGDLYLAGKLESSVELTLIYTSNGDIKNLPRELDTYRTKAILGLFNPIRDNIPDELDQFNGYPILNSEDSHPTQNTEIDVVMTSNSPFTWTYRSDYTEDEKVRVTPNYIKAEDVSFEPDVDETPFYVQPSVWFTRAGAMALGKTFTGSVPDSIMDADIMSFFNDSSLNDGGIIHMFDIQEVSSATGYKYYFRGTNTYINNFPYINTESDGYIEFLAGIDTGDSFILMDEDVPIEAVAVFTDVRKAERMFKIRREGLAHALIIEAEEWLIKAKQTVFQLEAGGGNLVRIKGIDTYKYKIIGTRNVTDEVVLGTASSRETNFNIAAFSSKIYFSFEFDEYNGYIYGTSWVYRYDTDLKMLTRVIGWIVISLIALAILIACIYTVGGFCAVGVDVSIKADLVWTAIWVSAAVLAGATTVVITPELVGGVERVPDLAISADYVMKLISTSN